MSETVPTSSPHEIGGYTIVEPLRGDQTFLAEAPGGRRLVLKILPAECLLEDQLHPGVYERLARVRELAERNIANLHGVERDGALTYLVWDHVAGTALSKAPSADLPYRDLLHIARQLVLVVESLHAAGIVHGSLKPGNVIYDREESRLRLTHVSPLLHTEPQRDADAIVQLMSEMLPQKKDRQSPLGAVLQQARTQRMPLRQLGNLLANVPEPGRLLTRREELSARKPSRGIKRRSLWGALAVILLGACASGVAWWYQQRQGDPYRLMGTMIRPATTPPATTASATTPSTLPAAPNSK